MRKFLKPFSSFLLAQEKSNGWRRSILKLLISIPSKKNDTLPASRIHSEILRLILCEVRLQKDTEVLYTICSIQLGGNDSSSARLAEVAASCQPATGKRRAVSQPTE